MLVEDQVIIGDGAGMELALENGITDGWPLSLMVALDQNISF